MTGTQGAVLAILATAPRPGLVLQAACPPLLPAEAGALQTAWLKHIAQELPGVKVLLCGRPDDALAMLRYFAGPGVDLRGWPAGGGDPIVALARELFAAGHLPVLIRTADSPEPTPEQLLPCVEAARRGAFVWAPDQRGGAWLCGFADPAQVEALAQGGPPAPQPRHQGPWARRVQDGLDWELLLAERGRGHGMVVPPPRLPVQNLQASLQFYEALFGARLVARQDAWARIAIAGQLLDLQASAVPFLANGLRLELPGATAQVAAWTSSFGMHAVQTDCGGGDVATDTTFVDPDGNRLTFCEPATAR